MQKHFWYWLNNTKVMTASVPGLKWPFEIFEKVHLPLLYTCEQRLRLTIRFVSHSDKIPVQTSLKNKKQERQDQLTCAWGRRRLIDVKRRGKIQKKHKSVRHLFSRSRVQLRVVVVQILIINQVFFIGFLRAAFEISRNWWIFWSLVMTLKEHAVLFAAAPAQW